MNINSSVPDTASFVQVAEPQCGYAYFPLYLKRSTGELLPEIPGWKAVHPGQYQAVGNYGVSLKADDLVIDADPRNYPEGRDVLLELMQKYALPQTRVVRTPRGGYHIYLKKPPELKVKVKQSEYPGIDFLSEDHYVVGPGSEKTAGIYAVVYDILAAQAPTALLGSLETPMEAKIAGTGFSLDMRPAFIVECKAADAPQPGNRSNALFRQACRGKDLGLPREVCFDVIAEHFNARSKEPFDQADLRKVVDNAYKHGKNAIGCETPQAKFEPFAHVPTQGSGAENIDSKTDTARQKESKNNAGVADALLQICQSKARYWCDPAGNAYATVLGENYSENYRLESKNFNSWVVYQYFSLTKKAGPSSRVLADVKTSLSAIAGEQGPVHEPSVRVANSSDAIYLDLCNAQWQAVEVTAGSWRVVADPQVKFLREPGMLELPVPVAADVSALSDFRALLGGQVDDEETWTLLLSFLVACFRPGFPFPVLALTAEQGSGKTTLIKAIRGLIDPSAAPVRGSPRNKQDLLIAASQAHLLAYDNLSDLPEWLSDTLCGLSTGSGDSFRKLYENAEQTFFTLKKPSIISGISDLATRADLLNRAIVINLPPLSAERRVSEADFWKAYYELRPRVIGALLTAVSGAMRRLRITQLEHPPRLMDFALWASAAEPDLGLAPGQFQEAFNSSSKSARGIALEASYLPQFLSSLNLPWKGGSDELLGLFVRYCSSNCITDRTIHKKPNALSKELKRLAPVMREEEGIDIDFARTSGKRFVQISRIAQAAQAKESP